jgi:hypothetical protein
MCSTTGVTSGAVYHSGALDFYSVFGGIRAAQPLVFCECFVCPFTFFHFYIVSSFWYCIIILILYHHFYIVSSFWYCIIILILYHHFYIVSSFLQIEVSDYSFGIFRLFFLKYSYVIINKTPPAGMITCLFYQSLSSIPESSFLVWNRNYPLIGPCQIHLFTYIM